MRANILIALLVTGVPFLAIAGLRAGEIHDASAAGDLNKVKALLEADSRLLESKGNVGFRPLHSACFAGQAAVANLLLDRGADVNLRDDFQNTPLGRACYVAGQDPALVERLIEQGADVNSQGYNGLTPLHYAALRGDVAIARLLLDRGADPDAFDTYTGAIGPAGVSGTALQVAINYHPQEEMARLLVGRGAKLGRKDSFGNTELHLAAQKGYAELARTLIQHGADVDAVNQSNRTALYYAARHGYRRTAEVLIAAGAKKSAVVEGNYGKAPQLATTLQEGEAWLWSLGDGGYAVKTSSHLVVFNPNAIDNSPEAGLANGCLNPNELADQKITGLITLPERWWQSFPVAFELAKRIPAVSSVVYPKPTAGGMTQRDIPSYRTAAPNESLSIDGMRVHVIAAQAGGLGYLVEADGVKVLHAGLHVGGTDSAQLGAYRIEIDFLKPFRPVDIAFVSVGSHSNSIEAAPEAHLYLIDQLSPRVVYLTGANIPEQYVKCAEVLRARNIPVVFPEEMRTKGERFHYLPERALATPAPDAAAPENRTMAAGSVGRASFRAALQATTSKAVVDRQEAFVCDYLNETPPGDEPVVFGRGVVSVEGRNTHALAFSPDGRMLIFSRYPDRTSFRMVQGKDGWSKPERTSFTGKEVTFAADAKRLFYYDRGELFSVRYGAGEFSAPIKLGAEINTSEAEYYPCMTGRGNLFFSRNSNWNEGRIMVAQPEGDGFGEPVDLGEVVNAGGASHGFVAPDESYLLFNSPRAGSATKNDIWVSVRGADGVWQAPVNLGPRINRDAMAVLCPTVSPDGRYLFFTRLQENGTGLLYWVNTANMPALRSRADTRQENPK